MIRDERERLRAELEQRLINERDEVEPITREEDAGAESREKEPTRDRERDNPPAEPPLRDPPVAESPTHYLLSEDSPLILYNIPDYVIDPESAIKEIKARVYGMGGGAKDGSARLFDERGKAFYPTTPLTRIDAETLMRRLKAFVAQDSRTIQETARQYGTRGEPREFYSLLTSPDRPLSNREIKQPILKLCEERFPLSPFIGYIHRDTDDAHAHGWLSALQINGLKLHVGKEKVDGRWVDRFKQLDEDYLRFYSEMVGDPSVLEEHLAKKVEWNEKKALVKTALANGECPPALPFRERLLYDELGERRQRKERRELEARGEDPGPKKRAAPVARCRSTWECAELWGKTVHAEARLRDARFRQGELDKLSRHVEVEVEGRRWSLHQVCDESRLLERRREGKEDARRAVEREKREAELRALEAKINEEIEARRILLTQELEELEPSHEQHRSAWEKTVANRERTGRSEIKYPLHNARQLEEIRDIAERTRDAELLRHVRDYELLDRPEGRDKQRREFAERWGREVMAEAGVHDEGHRLRSALRDEQVARPPDSDGKLRGDGAARAAEERMLGRLFDEWAAGGWSAEEVRQSLACVRDENLRRQAESYMRARDYHEATKEVLRDYREGAEGIAVPPALRPEEVERIKELLAAKDAVTDRQARAHLDNVADFASGEARVSPGGVRAMAERSLSADGSLSRADSRATSATERFDAARPLDDRWVARLTDVVALAETRALAAGMRETSVEKLDAARREVIERRETLEFVGWVRDRVGLSEPVPVRVPTDERRELEDLRRYVSQQLLRERPWTRGQVEQISEFGHRASEKDREGLVDAVNAARQRLDRSEVVRAEKPRESPTRADGRHAAADSRQPITDNHREPRQPVRETEVPTSRSGVITSEQSKTINQDTTREGSHEGRGRSSADRAEMAERLRVAWVFAAADSPSVALLQRRFAPAGVEVKVAGGEEGHPVSGVRLTYRSESFDARALDGRIDISKISHAKDPVIHKDRERAVEKCVEMAMLSRAEQDMRLSHLVNQRGRLSLEQVSNIHRTQYALLAVAAVRSGATPDWAGIDKQVAGMPRPKGLDKLDSEWLARTWGVGRLVELEKTGQRGAPMPMIRPMIPDRSPTRPSHDPTRDRTNRPGGGGSGRSSRGGR
jgi:hypothetical protein